VALKSLVEKSWEIKGTALLEYAADNSILTGLKKMLISIRHMHATSSC